MSEQSKKFGKVCASCVQMFDIMEGRWAKMDAKSRKTIEVKNTLRRYERVSEITLEEAVILLKKGGKDKKQN